MDDLGMSQGKKNIYTCEKCGAHIVTVDRDEGTTPFMTRCKADGCEGMMKSSFYRVFDQDMKPSHEWYRAEPADIAKMRNSRACHEHARMGGLFLREIAP
jgi:hypothetical protein